MKLQTNKERCLMKYLIALFLMLSGCSHKEARTKFTDPVLRILVDSDTIDPKNYVRITNALIKNGKFTVVDRGAGYLAARKEQERLHQDKVDRFDDREKYAHWKKLYGVGGIVIAHSQCQLYTGFTKGLYNKCRINLAIVNSSTGEVITTAEDVAETDSGYDQAADWSDAVDQLADNFPRHFEKDQSSAKLLEYKEVSKEEAIRAREITSDQLNSDGD